jgi:hypothetical protein
LRKIPRHCWFSTPRHYSASRLVVTRFANRAISEPGICPPDRSLRPLGPFLDASVERTFCQIHGGHERDLVIGDNSLDVEDTCKTVGLKRSPVVSRTLSHGNSGAGRTRSRLGVRAVVSLRDRMYAASSKVSSQSSLSNVPRRFRHLLDFSISTEPGTSSSVLRGAPTRWSARAACVDAPADQEALRAYAVPEEGGIGNTEHRHNERLARMAKTRAAPPKPV